MRHLLLAASLALAVLPAAPRAADAIALLPATGSNVHEGHLSAATDVLRGHLERTGRFVVTLVPSPAPAGQEASALQAGEVARASGTSLAVSVRVARLGATASVRLGAYRPDGSAAHLDELSAAGPDDLDPVLRRLALGLAEGRPARLLAEIDSVTEKESDPYLKYVATNVFGLRLGNAFLMNRAFPAGTMHSAAGGGIFWLYDARSFLADLAFDLHGGEDDRLVSLGIGFYRPLSTANFAPYVGGGVAYQWVSTGGDGASGLALKAAGGAVFGRLSTVQIRMEVGYAIGLFQEEVGGRDGRVPHGPLLSVGLGY
jgi:hypothetical protein